MNPLDNYTDEELGRMFRQAARGREAEALESIRSQNSLVIFLEGIGLYKIAALVKAAIEAWRRVKEIFDIIFG